MEMFVIFYGNLAVYTTVYAGAEPGNLAVGKVKTDILMAAVSGADS